jgi:hypothetical protein
MNQDNKWKVIIFSVIGVLLLVGLGGNFLLDKIADRVIQRLQKEYSPSPYGPGFDPDKISFDKFKKS